MEAHAVNGPPNKRTEGHFARTMCYEIRGDIFLLANLECLIVQGNMSNGANIKPPFASAPKTSKGHRVYALRRVYPRVNFLLNNSSAANPSSSPVLTPDRLDDAIHATSVAFLASRVDLDPQRRIATLPKVCGMYHDDFGDGDALHCLYFCLGFLDKDK